MTNPQDPNQPAQPTPSWGAPPPGAPGYQQAPGWGAPVPPKKKGHSCLIAFIIVLVICVVGVGSCTILAAALVVTATPSGIPSTSNVAQQTPEPATQGSTAPTPTVAMQASGAPANAGDANVVVQKTLVFPAASSYGGGNVQIIAVVKNTGGKPAKLGGVNSESFTLYAKDGSVLKTGDLTPLPQYLAPGATGYLGGWANFTDSAPFATVGKADASVTFGSADSIPAQTLKTAKVAVAPDDVNVWLEAKGTVTNSGTDTVDMGEIGIILLDSAGNPIGWLVDNTTAMGILAGQTKGFTTSYPFVPASLAPKVASTLVFAFAYELF